MASRRPFAGNGSAFSPAKDPRRQARMHDSSASPRQVAPLPPTQSIPAHLLIDDLEMARAGVAKIDFVSMLGVKRSAIQNVFVHMPPERKEEMEVLKRYLKKFGCRVDSDPVAWELFRQYQGTDLPGSLIILHPSELFNGTIPKLHSFIMEFSPRVFSIGVQHELGLREHRQPAYEALRFFPLGGITFISDDVFVYYPEKATEIINLFLEQTKNKPPGAETYKIGARPGIKDWMLRLAQLKFDEAGGEGKATDIRWIECYDALCRLCPPEDEDPAYPYHRVPLESSHLWSSWEESMPSFKGRWESGDEAGATAYMVNHFAGEACMKVWRYRRFYFVYQRPKDAKTVVRSPGPMDMIVPVDPMKWMERYCHLGVFTPDQVLRVMRKK